MSPTKWNRNSLRRTVKIKIPQSRKEELESAADEFKSLLLISNDVKPIEVSNFFLNLFEVKKNSTKAISKTLQITEEEVKKNLKENFGFGFEGLNLRIVSSSLVELKRDYGANTAEKKFLHRRMNIIENDNSLLDLNTLKGIQLEMNGIIKYGFEPIFEESDEKNLRGVILEDFHDEAKTSQLMNEIRNSGIEELSNVNGISVTSNAKLDESTIFFDPTFFRVNISSTEIPKNNTYFPLITGASSSAKTQGSISSLEQNENSADYLSLHNDNDFFFTSSPTSNNEIIIPTPPATSTSSSDNSIPSIEDTASSENPVLNEENSVYQPTSLIASNNKNYKTALIIASIIFGIAIISLVVIFFLLRKKQSKRRSGSYSQSVRKAITMDSNNDQPITLHRIMSSSYSPSTLHNEQKISKSLHYTEITGSNHEIKSDLHQDTNEEMFQDEYDYSFTSTKHSNTKLYSKQRQKRNIPAPNMNAPDNSDAVIEDGQIYANGNLYEDDDHLTVSTYHHPVSSLESLSNKFKKKKNSTTGIIGISPTNVQRNEENIAQDNVVTKPDAKKSLLVNTGAAVSSFFHLGIDQSILSSPPLSFDADNVGVLGISSPKDKVFTKEDLEDDNSFSGDVILVNTDSPHETLSSTTSKSTSNEISTHSSSTISLKEDSADKESNLKDFNGNTDDGDDYGIELDKTSATLSEDSFSNLYRNLSPQNTGQSSNENIEHLMVESDEYNSLSKFAVDSFSSHSDVEKGNDSIGNAVEKAFQSHHNSTTPRASGNQKVDRRSKIVVSPPSTKITQEEFDHDNWNEDFSSNWNISSNTAKLSAKVSSSFESSSPLLQPQSVESLPHTKNLIPPPYSVTISAASSTNDCNTSNSHTNTSTVDEELIDDENIAKGAFPIPPLNKTHVRKFSIQHTPTTNDNKGPFLLPKSILQPNAVPSNLSHNNNTSSTSSLNPRIDLMSNESNSSAAMHPLDWSRTSGLSVSLNTDDDENNQNNQIDMENDFPISTPQHSFNFDDVQGHLLPNTIVNNEIFQMEYISSANTSPTKTPTSNQNYPIVPPINLANVGGSYLGEVFYDPITSPYYKKSLANDEEDDEGNNILTDDNFDPNEEDVAEDSDLLFSDGDNESSSKQFINDLVWLEKRISEARTAATFSNNHHKDQNNLKNSGVEFNFPSSNSKSVQNGQSPLSPLSQNSALPQDKRAFYDELQKLHHLTYDSGLQDVTSPLSENCSYKDCFAPPGKLNILIQSTLDGPAIYEVSKDSSLYDLIFPGDLIVAIDNRDTRRMNAEEVMNIMKERSEFVRKITVLHLEEKI